MRAERILLLLLAAAPACTGTETAPSGAPSGPPAADAPAPALDSLPAMDLMTGALPGDRIPAFQAPVRRPGGTAAAPVTFDSRARSGTTVYIVNSTTCPYCEDYVERMKGIEASYMPRGVDVVHIYPIRAEPTDEKVRWHAAQGFRGGQIIDGDASIARALEAQKTPTVYVVDAKGVILYRGAIDDAPDGAGTATPFLANALDQHLAGKPVAVTTTEPAG